MTPKVCKDCGSGTRKLPHPGPRCGQCHRAVKAARRDAVWAAYILKTYGITSAQYWALYEAQGRACYICQRAKGTTKKLAVDHDHATGFVRGLLCGPCNKILGHLRDNATTAMRISYYLLKPPAFDAIGKVKPDV